MSKNRVQIWTSLTCTALFLPSYLIIIMLFNIMIYIDTGFSMSKIKRNPSKDRMKPRKRLYRKFSALRRALTHRVNYKGRQSTNASTHNIIIASKITLHYTAMLIYYMINADHIMSRHNSTLLCFNMQWERYDI